MIPSAKEYLTLWYETWKSDLEKNLAEQAVLQSNEVRLRELVATCEHAFGLLFPEPTPEPVNESPTPEPDLGNPEGGSVEGLAGPG